MSENNLTGHKGEWSEIYIFFKLLADKKVYAADKDLNKLQDVFLNIIRIIREEESGYEYSYYPTEESNVKILLNGKETSKIQKEDLKEYLEKIWTLISNEKGSFTDEKIADFLQSIFITKLKAPAQKSNKYFGGTQDITLETEDYRSGVHQIVGFSCKSDLSAAATLFNASGDNTNFEFKIDGKFSDKMMEQFNSITNDKGHTDINGRMKFLHDNNLDLIFTQPVSTIAEQNLILACGIEMPSVIGEMLYYYYYQNYGKSAGLKDALPWIVNKNPAAYKLSDLTGVYTYRIQTLLYTMFTGMRFGTPWNGKSEVNGGYIAVKNNGDVVAYHTCIADEFKEFLFENLRFESPSCSRHKCMSVYKKENDYFVKFPLQIRFAMKK